MDSMLKRLLWSGAFLAATTLFNGVALAQGSGNCVKTNGTDQTCTILEDNSLAADSAPGQEIVVTATNQFGSDWTLGYVELGEETPPGSNTGSPSLGDGNASDFLVFTSQSTVELWSLDINGNLPPGKSLSGFTALHGTVLEPTVPGYSGTGDPTCYDCFVTFTLPENGGTDTFTIMSDPTLVTPEPSAVFLLGTCMVGFAFLAYRKRKRIV